MLYGSSPFPDKTADDLGLKPVMKLAAQLIATEQLQPGEQVGYGGDWQAQKEMKVGTVNIGYGDGYSRQLSNKGKVWVHNQLVDVLGRVSMDMICIDLSSIQNVKIGDEVILWGVKELQVDSIATYANSISYELLCQVNNRVVRQYHG
jgi:alanine racemase